MLVVEGSIEDRRQATPLNPDEWVYLGKGMRHTVFRYVGDSALWKGVVVRFIRSSGDDCSDVKHCFRSLEWLEDVVMPSIGACLDLPLPRHVDRATADLFGDKAGHPLASAADIMPDYSDCDVLVEIKPKKGVIFSTNAWCDQGEPIHAHDVLSRQCCRHCMQQVTKKEKGKIREISLYCPVKLYQGQVDTALREMFACPQNNLIVRKRGRRVPCEDLGEEETNQLLARVGTALEESNVLPRLLGLSRRVPLDIDALEQARERGSKTITYVHNEQTCCLANEVRLGEFCAEELKGMPEHTPDSPISDRQANLSPEKMTVNVQKAIDAYFIARSAQDCSVMVMLFDNKSTVTKVIDMDQKPQRKYDRWYDQERRITKTYRATL